MLLNWSSWGLSITWTGPLHHLLAHALGGQAQASSKGLQLMPPEPLTPHQQQLAAGCQGGRASPSTCFSCSKRARWAGSALQQLADLGLGHGQGPCAHRHHQPQAGTDPASHSSEPAPHSLTPSLSSSTFGRRDTSRRSPCSPPPGCCNPCWCECPSSHRTAGTDLEAVLVFAQPRLDPHLLTEAQGAMYLRRKSMMGQW